ncbi:MAG: insulinase family protein [Campylobacteraceae bacterium]|jgi:predicted Zn-dependent peptidase|nr:insulinase family protein [Campylobacteraceae bacterium]
MKRIFLVFITCIGVMMANSLPQYETQTLSNGLQVFVVPMNKGSGVITMDVFYKVGSGDEIMGKSGIAHMLEHLNFKSTKNLKAGEFDEIVKSIGGMTNAATGFDFTHYFIKSSSKNLSKSFELFSELMANLLLKDDEFQPERDVVMEERKWRTDNSPVGYLYFRLFNSAFIYHPYHWTPIGFKDDIKNWTIEDIKNFHDTYYQPSNAIIVVAGDIEPSVVFKEAKKYFGNIKRKSIIPKKYQTEPEQDGAKRVYITKESETQMIAIAYKIPAFDHPDQVALNAISALLGNGKSSRLYEVLVNQKNLVNQISAYNMSSRDPNLFLFLAICNPNVKAEDVEKEILTIIEDLKKNNVGEDELKKVKTNTKADFIFGLESSSGIANLFGSFLARGSLEPLLNYEEAVNALKVDTIREVANRYFIEKHSTTVILRKEASSNE